MVTYYYRKFGHIFIIPGLFGNKDIIAALNPADYPTIFRNEGQWPKRRNFDSMLYYREVYRKDFFQGVEGIITTYDFVFWFLKYLIFSFNSEFSFFKVPVKSGQMYARS